MANQVLYGFMALKDVFADRVTTVGVDVVNQAIDATLQEHNRQLEAMLDLFTVRTTDHQLYFKSATNNRLQPLDEYGRALPIKRAGKYTVAWPIQGGGTAWGETYIASKKMTVADANDITNTLILGDINWMRDHILAALYFDGGGDGTGWTYSDPEFGDLDVKGLADGDTTQYQVMTGVGGLGSTDDHLLGQAAGIADATDPFETVQDELSEHPENSGDIIAFVPSTNVAATRALNSFYPARDPNIQEGSGTAVLVGNIGVDTPGKLFGYHDAGVWLYEWPALPADYIIGLSIGGDRPLRMREHAEAALQGFTRVAERNDHPYYESQYLRLAGFGAWNRVGAVVIRTGNATYAVPTNYSSPMP